MQTETLKPIDKLPRLKKLLEDVHSMIKDDYNFYPFDCEVLDILGQLKERPTVGDTVFVGMENIYRATVAEVFLDGRIAVTPERPIICTDYLDGVWTPEIQEEGDFARRS